MPSEAPLAKGRKQWSDFDLLKVAIYGVVARLSRFYRRHPDLPAVPFTSSRAGDRARMHWGIRIIRPKFMQTTQSIVIAP